MGLNILVVNWTWYAVGGDWTYISNLNELYKSYGHVIIPFSMKCEKNENANGFEKYFVNYIDYKKLNEKKNIANGIKAVTKSIYSFEAQKKLKKLLRDQRIDVAHLHNINHYLTPSILPILKKHRIPIIWTLHDYTLICPENSLVSNGTICENCKGGKFFHCALQACKKKSFLASFLASIENYSHRYLNMFKHVDYFLCPSNFLYKKMLEFNFCPEKMVVTNLCFETEKIEPEMVNISESFVLFVGRVEKTKGIMTLIKAVEGTDVNLKIAGTGSYEQSVKNYIDLKKLLNVSMLGFKSKSDVHRLIRSALCVICPSESYENFPFAVIESLSLKTAVIASAIGGIPELIIDQRTGLLYEPKNILQLRENLLRLIKDNDLRNQLVESGYHHVNSLISVKSHYQKLKKIYNKLGLNL